MNPPPLPPPAPTPTPPFTKGIVWASVVNGGALMLAVGILFLALCGLSMSSQPTEGLKETWRSFAALAFCVPLLANPLLLLFIATRTAPTERPTIFKGWGVGLLLAALLWAALGGCTLWVGR